ncbi:DUF1549 domain-containing protein [Rosistilla oblonga]|uniref:DUF1549 domain-containing protein n=1 Tax=Rosistilla oblonga TaxID=2527990 RepID=UPI003A975C94
MRATCCLIALLSLPLVGSLYAASPATSEPTSAAVEPPGMGAPGNLQSIEIVTGREVDGIITLRGRDIAQQCVVLGHYESGQIRDVTRDVQWQPQPAGIVDVSETGYISTLAEGDCTVTAAILGADDATQQTAKIAVRVENLVNDVPINFPDQITPIFTKFGCNGGGCHGKSGGQNGFRMSLLGFEPQEDYEWLVAEGRNRRVFPTSPDHSLLLQKASGVVPHGGGSLVATDSPSYRVMRRWIAQGMPYGSPDDPVVVGIDVLPLEMTMQRGSAQQLTVVARYSDGSTQDVTRTTAFESNDTSMAEVDDAGLVSVDKLSGSVAVMARYQGHVGVFRASIPLGLEVPAPESLSNPIDGWVFENLQELGLPPSPTCDDVTFLRRATIDIVGRLPSIEETRAFIDDTDPERREKLIDRLLASPDYASHFATKWSAILRNKRNAATDRESTFAFYRWLHEAFDNNVPYDQWVRGLLTASGSPDRNAAVGWYREVKDPESLTEDTAQLFMGLRLQCARCHHHPFEVWSQQDYYGLTAFFSRVGRKTGDTPGELLVVHRPGNATATNPKNKQAVPPTSLGNEPLTVDAWDDPRTELADWLTNPDNPFFARAIVNRYWKHYFGRGLVDPEDDMRVTNPASNPKLLDGLAQWFVDSGYDLKALTHLICTSQTYQRSSEPNDWNADDKLNFSRFYPRRLAAETLLSAIDTVTEVPTQFAGMPAGTSPYELPDNGFNSYFLSVFGRPAGSSACECERSGESNLAQCLHLINSKEVQSKLTGAGGRIARLAAEKSADDALVEELYLAALSRKPIESEAKAATDYLASKPDRRLAIEDLVWAIINTKEFLFNH